jgi:hypothetical protein
MASLKHPRSDRRAEARRPVLDPLVPWLVLAGLLAFTALQYGYALHTPFINDDYIFLDKTRSPTLATVWAPRDLLFHYYRPWSRELHYAVLQRVFGPRELPFHLAGVALWVAVMGLYFVLARRLAGAAVATIATMATAALAAWVVPITWVAGAQDLWMLLFALVLLHSVAHGRTVWAAVALTLALLSKETAAILPAIAAAYHHRIGRRGVRDSLRLTAPLWGTVVVWAALHPLLGGRLRSPIADEPQPGLHPPIQALVARSAQALVNLYPWPRPEHGWADALRVGVPAAALLAGLVFLGTRSRRPRAKASAATATSSRVADFGLLWALIALCPLLMPSIGWRAHYVLLAALGVWLAFATLLASRPGLACAIVAALALLRPAVGGTPSGDWSSEWYRRRAAAFVEHIRADLMRRHPELPRHTRLYFVRAPSDVGFLAGDGPALRVWYRDPTLRAGYYSSYRSRDAAAPPGPDLFFRFDSTSGWVEVRPGAEDLARARAENPRWEQDHVTLARAMADGGDWRRAAAEFLKLAEAAPSRFEYAFDAGACLESLGDSSAAAEWYARAAGRPGADAEVRRNAERLAHLRGTR